VETEFKTVINFYHCVHFELSDMENWMRSSLDVFAVSCWRNCYEMLIGVLVLWRSRPNTSKRQNEIMETDDRQTEDEFAVTSQGRSMATLSTGLQDGSPSFAPQAIWPRGQHVLEAALRRLETIHETLQNKLNFCCLSCCMGVKHRVSPWRRSLGWRCVRTGL
jgi:hypothetical protein